MIISGKKLAEKRQTILQKKAEELTKALKRAPKLAVVLVGEDPASQVYVGHKQKACAKVGVESQLIKLPKDSSEKDVIEQVKKLNFDLNVDGILVQLPMPEALKGFDPTDYISASKDVDGLTSENMGLMLKNKAWAEPCTPKGIMHLLKEADVNLQGKKAVVIGRSHIVGWPMSWMLTRANATVTVCHSRTLDLEEKIKASDVVVVAAGKPEFLNLNHFKKDSVVIDVGIHRKDGKLVGDVDTSGFDESIKYTPVPGGVGPMTVSVLLENLLELAEKKL